MRVAVVPFNFPVFSETFVLNIVCGLLDRGHEVDILPLFRFNEESKIIHPTVEKYGLLKRTIYPPSIALGRKRFYGPWPLRSCFFAALKPYDIVHFQFGEAALKCLPFRHSRALGGKWVVSFRGYDISSFLNKNGVDVYKTLFREGDLFLSNSELFRRRLIGLGCDEKKAVVYRSGVDCARFGFDPKVLRPGQRVKLLTVGRLVEKKGIEYSIRAVAALLKENLDLEYDVIGDGPLKDHLQGLIDGLGVSGRVRLWGAQDQKFVIERLRQAHIFLSTGIIAKDGDENGPDNTIKEAMAVGLPVVASRSGAFGEVVEDGKTGFLTEERDVDSISRRIKHLAEHPEIWPEMTQAARKFVGENYNLNKLNDELVLYYQQVLNGKS